MIHNDALAGLSLPQVCCREEPVGTLQEACLALSRASVGGAALIGSLREALLPFLDQISDAAEAIGAVDCVFRREDGRLMGEVAGNLALRARLGALGFNEGASGRVGLVLGRGIAARTALFALTALGFGRVLYAIPITLPDFTVTIENPNTSHKRLGLEVSHDNGTSLLVEVVAKGSPIDAWNNANSPGYRIRPGDSIVEVNGAQGQVQLLLDKINRDKLLKMRLVRSTAFRLADSIEQLEDLAALAMLPAVDACVLAELTSDECNSIRGSQWIPAMLERSKPVFVDMSWPPDDAIVGKASLLEVAKTAGCAIVDGPELLFEQARACTSAWTGKEVVSHQHLARALVDGWTSEADHLRQVVMEVARRSSMGAEGLGTGQQSLPVVRRAGHGGHRVGHWAAGFKVPEQTGM